MDFVELGMTNFDSLFLYT